MKEAGYQIDFIPEDTEVFMKRLTAQATNDRSMLTEEQEAACQKVPKKLYCDLFATFPEETRRQMEKDWGKAPGRVMTTESGDILVPGLMDGHIFLTVQARAGMALMRRRSIMILLSHRRISIWHTISGSVMYGELMPWSMWGRMEIWNGFRGKVRGWIEEAILI